MIEAPKRHRKVEQVLPQSQPPLPKSEVVRIQLTANQAEQLAPLAIGAVSQGENVLFVAVAVPFWSRKDEKTIWELQVKTISARIGQKLKTLVQSAVPPAEQIPERLQKSRREANAQ